MPGLRGYAAGGKPSLAGLTVAYAAARAVGSIPLMPGGLLVVEAVLVPGLVSSGMTLASAISAMLIYRLVSWIFISAIGWVVFFFMFRTEKDVDPDATGDDVGGQGATAAAFSPDPEAVYEAEVPPPHRLRPDPEARHQQGTRPIGSTDAPHHPGHARDSGYRRPRCRLRQLDDTARGVDGLVGVGDRHREL